MRCIVTAGPTYESLDDVRRLTNFSTGKLGAQLARHLVARGHSVTLLQGYYAIHREDTAGVTVETFTTTDDLAARLHAQARSGADAVFHAAAVSDFKFGKRWLGSLSRVSAQELGIRLVVHSPHSSRRRHNRTIRACKPVCPPRHRLHHHPRRENAWTDDGTFTSGLPTTHRFYRVGVE